ncbi:low temperature requirement protein A [Nocardioides taihuensis]|uniref:Low temperature requirement protein A n=1 Tax=Nocardioides taihuensis TaxID=1835606 RepID=A0ABW0BK09_9ACTN
MTTEPETAAEERHATWAELFFDLVAVAGVAALAHVLQGEITLESLGLYALLFLAFWLSWTTFMLYGNVAGGDLRLVRLLVAMFGIGVMAAAVPSVAHTLLDGGHETRMLSVFALAYFLTRVIGANSWGRDQVVVDFPVVQHTAGALPWLASIWVDEPWKVALWVLGIAIDLFTFVVFSADDALDAVSGRVEAVRARIEKERARDPARAERHARRMVDFTVKAAPVERAHLAERLGLFVIIVLGEGVVQVVTTAGEAEPHRALLHAGVASFVLLSGMFALSLLYGYAGIPHLRADRVPMRAALGLHCLVTATIAAVAVALATVIEHGGEPLEASQRWLLCGGMATYFGLGVVASLAAGVRWPRLVGGLVTGVGVPLLLGVVATGTGGVLLVWYVVLVVAGHLVAEWRAERASAP